MSVLVVGEALVDLIVSPDGSTTAVPGGGPFNAARAIGQLGVPVTFGGQQAIVVAGITCQRPGADPPRLHELP